MKKICAPDFALEKKTHAADPLVHGIVLLASVLSFASVFGLLSCMILSITDCLLVYSLIPVWVMAGYMALVLIPCIVLCIKGLAVLYTSYAISPDCITKGTLCRIPDKIEVDTSATTAASAAVAGAVLASGLNATSKIQGVTAAGNMASLITRIRINSKAGFAEAYFDTDCYKKKDYPNPVLVKETSRAYIYRCEKNKKLTIPKLYTNMGVETAGDAKEQSIFKRITKKIGLSFVAALACTALMVGVGTTATNQYRTEIMPEIEQTIAALGDTLSPLGYAYDAPSVWASDKLLTDATFRHHNEEIESSWLDNEITYDFAADGSISSIAFEIYFTAEDATVAAQVFAVLDTAPNAFSQETLDEIAAAITATQEGSYIHNAMTSDDGACAIKVSRYNDYYYIRTVDD